MNQENKKEDSKMTIYEDTRKNQIKLSPGIIRRYLGGDKCSDQDIMMFLMICKSQRLNPFLREAYLLNYGGKTNIVVGKDTFTKRASEHPDYNGMKAGIIVDRKGEMVHLTGSFKMKSDQLVGGYAIVYRRSWDKPVTAEVSMEEYRGAVKSSWDKIPCTMIRKVALVQALREAFPAELGGMYDSSEMGQAGVDSSQMDSNPVPVPDESVVKENDVMELKPQSKESTATLEGSVSDEESWNPEELNDGPE